MSNIAKSYYNQYREYLAGLESMTPEQQTLKIIELWPVASNLKYIWDANDKLVAPDKVIARGYGVCHDQARVHAYLAKNNHVKYESIVLVDNNDPIAGSSHSATFWFANKEVYLPCTTEGSRKDLYKTKESNYALLLNRWIAQRFLHGIAWNTIGSMVQRASNSYTRFFDMLREKMNQTQEPDPVIYKVDLLDPKLDNMKYDKFIAYVRGKYEPYEIKNDKILDDREWVRVV